MRATDERALGVDRTATVDQHRTPLPVCGVVGLAPYRLSASGIAGRQIGQRRGDPLRFDREHGQAHVTAPLASLVTLHRTRTSMQGPVEVVVDTPTEDDQSLRCPISIVHRGARSPRSTESIQA